MKRLILTQVFLFMVLITSGCVLWQSPKEGTVTVKTGGKITFNFIVASSNVVYEWRLDGEVIPATRAKYLYTAIEDDKAYHE